MSSEENLVRQAIDGNQSAFTQLYDEHFDRIYRYIYFRVNSRAEAEDLTQEVFLKALQAIGSYKWRDVPFASWLFRIAHNQVIDHSRKQSKQKRAPLEEAAAVSMEDPVAMTEQNVVTFSPSHIVTEAFQSFYAFVSGDYRQLRHQAATSICSMVYSSLSVHPSSSIHSRHSSAASLMFFSASSTVLPCEIQPGMMGT